MSEFHVGEIAIYVRPGSPNYGKELTILSPLKMSAQNTWSQITGEKTEPFLGYEVDFPLDPTLPGNSVMCRPEWLRKKQQKRDIDQIVSWDDCLWKPKREMA
jgi:hypothetical protein